MKHKSSRGCSVCSGTCDRRSFCSLLVLGTNLLCVVEVARRRQRAKNETARAPPKYATNRNPLETHSTKPVYTPPKHSQLKTFIHYN